MPVHDHADRITDKQDVNACSVNLEVHLNVNARVPHMLDALLYATYVHSRWVVVGSDHADALPSAMLVENGTQGDALWVLREGAAVYCVFWLVCEAAKEGCGWLKKGLGGSWVGVKWCPTG